MCVLVGLGEVPNRTPGKEHRPLSGGPGKKMLFSFTIREAFLINSHRRQKQDGMTLLTHEEGIP